MPIKGDPDWAEYKGCKTKRRFAAEPIIGCDYSAGWVRHYRCNFCDGWHLTSKPRTGRRKQEEAARDAARQMGYRGFPSKEAYEAHYSDPASYAHEIQSMEDYTNEAEAERAAS